jgi:predicted ABC-type ATPase
MIFDISKINAMKRLMMIAGPNGAGKTTTAKALLSQSQDVYDDFLNADHIAQGISPLHPESVNRQAGELMIMRFHQCLKIGMNFAFETTASGLTYATHIKTAKAKGYEISLIYLWLSSPDQAVKRVAERVKQGGHDVPEEDIRRRYFRGMKNLLKLYLPLADTALILDNSSTESGIRKIIAKKEKSERLQIDDNEIWERMQGLPNAKG